MNPYVKEWRDSSIEEKNRREQLVTKLKRKQPSNIDQLAQQSNEEVIAKVDCLSCGNCCRSTVTDFSSSDISRASKFLGVSKKAFIRSYLMQEYDGTYITNHAPCPFLQSDNKCQIYEARPEVCRSYPHTHKSSFLNRTIAHKANVHMCPITFHVIESIYQKISNDL